MIISAINNFNRTNKNKYTNNTKASPHLTKPQNLTPLTNDSFSYSNKSAISFGIGAVEFPFNKKTLDFVIPNKFLRRVKPNIQKIIHPVDVPTSDGLILKSWFIEPKDNKPIFYFLNGTNYNKTHQDEVVKFFDRNGYGALMPDYREFGDSSRITARCALGEDEIIPTADELYEDAASGLHFLNKQGLKDQKLVLWGYSMGGQVARKISTMNEFRCGIIDSAPKHQYAIQQHFLESGIAPPESLDQESLAELRKKFAQNTNIPFDTTGKIKDINYPLLFLHSKGDGIVPHEMTEEQFKLSKHKDSKLVISNGTDPHFYRNWTFDHISNFVDALI